MMYVYLCHEFGIKYDPCKPKKLKIWATRVEIDLPKLVTNSKKVTQRLEVLSLTKVKDKRYIFDVINKTGNRMSIRVTCNIYML